MLEGAVDGAARGSNLNLQTFIRLFSIHLFIFLPKYNNNIILRAAERLFQILDLNDDT